MAEPDISEEIRQKLTGREQSDIVVGIPTFNNAATIGHVVRMVKQGLCESFPSSRCIIVNADAGSKDGTIDLASDSVQNDGMLLQLPYRPYPIQDFSRLQTGIPNKGIALQRIFTAAKILGAKACAVFSPQIQSVVPDWIGTLIQPVLDGKCDLVGAFYARHKFDGAIANSIIYPVTRSLYGKRIRYPIGGESCSSSRLLDYFLSQEIWDGNTSLFGIDLWMTTQAICGGFRPAQVYLGKRTGDPNEPAADLSTTLKQILTTMFTEMEKNARIWQRIRGSETIPMFGGNAEIVDSTPLEVSTGRMIESYRIGFRNLFELWSLILPPAALLELKKLAQSTNENFLVPDLLWAHIVYDFAVAFHLKTMNRDHLLSALTPLYLGWVASFILQLQQADAGQVDARIEELCLRFEAEKPYLISRWRWPDRFNP